MATYYKTIVYLDDLIEAINETAEDMIPRDFNSLKPHHLIDEIGNAKKYLRKISELNETVSDDDGKCDWLTYELPNQVTYYAGLQYEVTGRRLPEKADYPIISLELIEEYSD